MSARDVTIVTSIRLPRSILNIVDRRARETKKSRNAKIIEVLELWIEENPSV